MGVVESHYTVVLGIGGNLDREVLFETTWEDFTEIWQQAPVDPDELSLFLDGSSTYLDLPAGSLAEARRRILKAWMEVERDCTVFGMNYGNTVISSLDSLGFTCLPTSSRWKYLVALRFESTNYRDSAGFTRIATWARTLFEKLGGDIAIAANHYLVDRMLREAASSRSLDRLLTLTEDWDHRQAEIRKLVGAPERAGFEDFMNNYGEQFPWNDTYVPAWFYLLSRKRFEASLSQLPDLPLEAQMRFPDLKNHLRPRLEPLSSGGACLWIADPVALF